MFHALRDCPWSAAVCRMSGISWLYDQGHGGSFADWIEANMLAVEKNEFLRRVILMWLLRFNRNKLVHGETIDDGLQIVKSAHILSLDYIAGGLSYPTVLQLETSC